MTVLEEKIQINSASPRYLEEQEHRLKIQSRLRELEAKSRDNELEGTATTDQKLSSPLPGEVSLVWHVRWLNYAIFLGGMLALMFYALRNEMPSPSKSLESIEGWFWVIGLVIGLFAVPIRSAFCDLRISSPKPAHYIASRHTVVRALLNILLLILSAFIGWMLSCVFIALMVGLFLSL